MPVRIWQSFSCNNSSSYRLVARFVDKATAKATAKDLGAFFKAYATEMDALVEANDYTWPNNWPPGALAFAKQHGFKLDKHPMSWGDTGLTDDEPKIVVEDDTLLVFHDYCGGGLGRGMHGFLKARGARDVSEEDSGPQMTLMFPYAGGTKKLDNDLAKLFAQVEEFDYRDVEPLVTPWKGHEAYGSAAFYRDPKTVAMVFPFDPRDLPLIRAWLAKYGIHQPVIHFCDDKAEEKFASIAGAICDACAAPLELWHPALRDVETEQMACTACGGLYELSTVMAAQKKRRKARERAEAKAAEAAAVAEAAKAAVKKPAKKKPPKKKR